MLKNRVFWITGLPAAGKTTLAVSLQDAFKARGQTAILLDGDLLRHGLCADLGLSPADRQENIRRAGQLASLLHSQGVNVVCAFVSPYKADRDSVRALFAKGEFVEIHLSTSLAECQRRDPKGLYARAASGQLQGLTGLDAPYEAPSAPEHTFDTTHCPADAIASQILDNHAHE